MEHFTIVVVNVYEEFVEIIIIVVSNNREQWSSIFTAHDRFFDDWDDDNWVVLWISNSPAMILEGIFHFFLNERLIPLYIAIVEILQATSCELLPTGAARTSRMRLTIRELSTIFDKWNQSLTSFHFFEVEQSLQRTRWVIGNKLSKRKSKLMR